MTKQTHALKQTHFMRNPQFPYIFLSSWSTLTFVQIRHYWKQLSRFVPMVREVEAVLILLWEWRVFSLSLTSIMKSCSHPSFCVLIVWIKYWIHWFLHEKRRNSTSESDFLHLCKFCGQFCLKNPLNLQSILKMYPVIQVCQETQIIFSLRGVS